MEAIARMLDLDALQRDEKIRLMICTKSLVIVSKNLRPIRHLNIQ
jgi:hypothetical protein